jgi:hypothetical protein
MRSSDISNAITAELALQNPKIVKEGLRKKTPKLKKKINTLSTPATGNQLLPQDWHNMRHKIQPTKCTILDI